MENPAAFEVREYLDVFRDPFGHYHHYLVILGRLAAGRLEPGMGLALPTRTGGQVVVRVLGIDGGFRRGQVSIAYAGSDTLAVCTYTPAIPSELLSLDLAVAIAEDRRIPILCDALACSDRAAFLHAMRVRPEDHRYFGITTEDEPFVCEPCLGALRDVPELGSFLHSALTDPRAEVVAAAARALAVKGTHGDIEHLTPLAGHSAAGVRAEVARTLLLRLEAPGRSDVLDRLARDTNIRVRRAALPYG